MTSRTPTSPDLLIGRTIGTHYVISRLLGRGLRSATYLAEHRSLHREVVVKLLESTWAADSDAASRFEQAARSLSTLEAPNVGALIDFGRDPGRGVYVVTEFIEGETLEHFIARHGALDIDSFVPVAAQLLKGLGAAHLRGLLHLDLTLNNILLSRDEADPSRGIIRILDLGLVQLIEGHIQGIEAPTGGDPRYLAPEQIANRPLDSRTDVYGLGALFYQLLTGRPPFTGTDAQVIYNHVNDEPPALDEIVTGSPLPRGLIDLIERCLAKDPDDRPNDANEIVEYLIDSVPAALFRGHIPPPSFGDDDAEDLSDDLEEEDTSDEVDAAASADARLAAPVLGDSVTETHDDPKDAPTPAGESSRRAPAIGDLALSDPKAPDKWSVADDPANASSGGRPTVREPVVESTASTSTTEEKKSGGSGFLIFLFLVAIVIGVLFVVKPELLGLGPPPPQGPPVTQQPPQELPPTPADIGSLLADAKALEARGELIDATATYHQILALDPEHPEANARLQALKAGDSDTTTTTETATTGDDGATTGDDGATTGDDDETSGETETTSDGEGSADSADSDESDGNAEASGSAPEEGAAIPIKFAVKPRGTLYVDGKKVGSVPGTHSLRPGPRKIKVESGSRYNPYEKTHTIEPGMAPLEISLRRKPKDHSGENVDIDPMAEGPATEFKFKK